MANYVFSKGMYRGHSVNDTIPTPVGKYLKRRKDTDTGIVWYSDGTAWVKSGQASAHNTTHYSNGTDVLDIKSLGGFAGGSTAYLRADGTFNIPPGGSATAVIKETIAYGFQGTAVRVSSMIMGTNHSTNAQGTSGHVWGVPLVVKRVRIIPVTNAKTGSTVIKLWKNSTELASWTITAGSTTEIDSGAITHAITNTEKLDFTYDSTAGGAALSITIGILVDIEKTVNLT